MPFLWPQIRRLVGKPLVNSFGIRQHLIHCRMYHSTISTQCSKRGLERKILSFESYYKPQNRLD